MLPSGRVTWLTKYSGLRAYPLRKISQSQKPPTWPSRFAKAVALGAVVSR